MAARGIQGRPARQAGERRRLGHAQPLHALPEQIAARRFDTVGAVAEVDDVEIELEDLLLGERVLEPASQLELDELSAQGALVRQVREEGAAHHLHGDGAEPFADVERGEVTPEGATGASPIDPAVMIEAAVLDGDERRAQVTRHAGERHVDPADVGQPAERNTIAVEDAAPLARPERLELGRARTAGEAAAPHPHHGTDHEDQRSRRGEDSQGKRPR